MAVKKATEQTQTTALANWDEELARQAKIATQQEQNVGGGASFSMRAGILKYEKEALPHSQVACIITDSIIENAFYTDDFDPDAPATPACFALGRNELELAPHLVVINAKQAKSETCAPCPNNVYGSADKGKGKACKNGRRLALIPAGEFDKSGGTFMGIIGADKLETAALARMKLPPTALKAYAAYVRSLDTLFKRPPHGVITRIKVEPSEQTQIKVSFECLGKVPDSHMAVVMARHEEAGPTLEVPYPVGTAAAPAAAGGKKAAAKKKPASNKKY